MHAESEFDFNVKGILTVVAKPHKWWSALKQSLFGIVSSLPPLCKSDGCLAHDTGKKISILFSMCLLASRVMLRLLCPSLGGLNLNSLELLFGALECTS